MVGASANAAALPERIVRIGTGGTGGTYFPVGSLIAQIVSEANPPATKDQPLVGVKGLLAVAQISSGSVSNLEALRNGWLDLALVQADVAHWAYHSSAIYEGQGEFVSLRAIANLYPESMHLVARLGSGIRSIDDLRGRRVSLDDPGSGTVIDAKLLLQAHDISLRDFFPFYMKPHFAAQAIVENRLDAFFIFAGYPAKTILELSMVPGAQLVPIAGPKIDALLGAHPYFGKGVIPDGTYGKGMIPAGTYRGVGDTPTVTVGAQLVVHERLEPELIYEMTKALWTDAGLKILKHGHPKGKEIQRDQALVGVSVPLHEGARRYYEDAGLVKVKN